VIRYAYLWRAEYLRGQEEGVKDRPCAMVMVSVDEKGDQVVTVVPVTHTPPGDADAVEIPAATKRRLGLDDQRSWIVVNEANVFVWPGPDLRPSTSGAPEIVAYGLLPRSLFHEVRERFLRCAAAGAVKRTE